MIQNESSIGLLVRQAERGENAKGEERRLGLFSEASTTSSWPFHDKTRGIL